MAVSTFRPDVWAPALDRQLGERTVLDMLAASMPEPTRWRKLRWRIRRATTGRLHAWIHRNCNEY